jgi:hypothetical protein
LATDEIETGAGLTGLEQRIAVLEARTAIAETCARYSHAIDSGDEQGWADTFTADGVFDTRDREENQLRVVEGRAQLLDFAAHFSRRPERWHKHLMFASIVTVTGERTAENAAYQAVLVEHESNGRVWEFGRYRDTLARGEDGVWRFTRRIAITEAMSPDIPLLAFTHEPA